MTAPFLPPVAFRPGPFRRLDALAAGYGRRDIDAFLAAGLWVTLRKGIYVDAEVVRSATATARHALDVAAAVLVVEDGVGSHESAALVHGLELWPAPSRQVTVSRPGRDRVLPLRGTAPGLVLHGRAVPAADRCERFGAPVTTPARTIVDLATDRDFTTALVAAESALRGGAVTAAGLRAAVATMRATGGAPAAAREVVEAAGPESESVLESLSWARFLEHGVELPRRQCWIGSPADRIGRVDFLWSRQRVVGEADGLEKYRADPESLIREKLRQERLERAGFTVVRWTWTDMVGKPAATIARIRAALRRTA